LRTVKRPRHYVAARRLALLRPLFRYSYGRDAFVLRLVGSNAGPVLRVERRRRQRPFAGQERRGREPERLVPRIVAAQPKAQPKAQPRRRSSGRSSRRSRTARSGG
jgi:hypothetical protein